MTTTDTLYCSEEFLDRAVIVYDTLDGCYVVWLIDFDKQLATVCSLKIYEMKEFKAYRPPTKVKFLEFLKAQKRKASEHKTFYPSRRGVYCW